MRKLKIAAFGTLAAAALALLVSFSPLGISANLPLATVTSGCSEPSQLLNCLNQAVTAINALVTPQSMAPATTPRNLLDNGSFIIQQRGAAERTCAQAASAATTAAYGADRWTCQANVTSGAGFSSIATATPTPPPGFQYETKLYRKTASLTQPVCIHQEISSAESIPLQGQSVMLSAYVQALAAGAAGQPVTLYVYYGTSTDEGFGTQGSANAIPPAWTGIAVASSTSFSNSSATAWTRYNSTPTPIPTTATEVGVAVCYTPSATGTAGVTDGIAITGVQLEALGVNATTPSPYEFKTYTQELQRAYRTMYTLAEPADARLIAASGRVATTSTCVTSIPFPVVMRAAPTFTALGTALGTGTWVISYAATTVALASTFYATTTANSTTAATGTWTVNGTPLTVGQACQPAGANGGSVLSWSADF